MNQIFMNDMNTNLFSQRLAEMVLAIVLFGVSLGTIGGTTDQPSQPIDAVNTPTQVPLDLVDERPSAIGAVWNYSTEAIGWAWNGLYDNVLHWVSPPSPGSLVSSISKPDAVKLFKLLNYAGYKLKMIDTDVGIIPGIKIKFGQVRELSDADVEYLDNQLEEWEEGEPGMYDAIQRSIMKTVMAINASGDYRVTSLEVKLLPLPDVGFTMIPKKVFLGEESSVLMRAIQRVERGIRTIKDVPKK